MPDGIELFTIMRYPTDIKITIVVIIHDGENILIVRKPEEPASVLSGKIIFPSSDLREGEDYTKMPEIAQRIIRHDLGLEIETGKIFGAVANPSRLVEDPGTKEVRVEFVFTVCIEAKLVSALESRDIEVLARWKEAKWVPVSKFFDLEFDAARRWLPETVNEYLRWLHEKIFDSNQRRSRNE